MSYCERAGTGDIPGPVRFTSIAPCVAAAIVLFACCGPGEVVMWAAQPASSAYQSIRAFLDGGHARDAEGAVLKLLEQYPSDATALGLMGVVLDVEGRSADAEIYYSKALTVAPKSAFVLNNLGRHYLARNNYAGARDSFTKVLAYDSANSFALLQMASLSVTAGDGRAALDYVNRLPQQEQSVPDAVLVCARALHAAGQERDAVALLQGLQASGPAQASVCFSAALLLAEWHDFAAAQHAFARALEAEPASFNIRYNLAIASAEAGDLDRAREIFEQASAQRPGDVDCIYHLALVYEAQGDYARTLPALIRAVALSPRRIDVLKTIAKVTEKLGMYGDSARAWDRMVALQPGDDTARRERGFALASSGDSEKGLADLRWFHAIHPQDPDGLYQLAVAESVEQVDDAIAHLNAALGVKPGWVAAHYVRAALFRLYGKTEEARNDVEFVLRSVPDNVRALDLLARIELQQDHPERAAEKLARALKSAPDDREVLLHYSQALRRLDRAEEASQVGAKLKSLGSAAGQRQVDAWAFDLYQQSPARQRAQYIAALGREITGSPENVDLRIALAEALLAQGSTDEAVAAFREAVRLSSDGDAPVRCAKDLFGAGLYAVAADLLRIANARGTASDRAVFDLAIADFYASGRAQALADLETIAKTNRNAEFYLLQAEILDASHEPGGAVEALVRAQSAQRPAGAGPEFYLEFSSMLLMHGRPDEALGLLQSIEGAGRDHRDLMLAQAVASALLRQFPAALNGLALIEKRWPEWNRQHLVRGAVLAQAGDTRAAIQALKIAVAAGPGTAAAACYVAVTWGRFDPAVQVEVAADAGAFLRAAPKHPYCQLFAGLAAYHDRDYEGAMKQLQPLATGYPGWEPADAALRAAYRASGRSGGAGRDMLAAHTRRVQPAATPHSAILLLGAKLQIPAAAWGAGSQ